MIRNSCRIPVIGALLGCALLTASGPGATAEGAAPNCARREQVVEQLANRYGETRQSIGLASNNAVMEVFASPETGSWTITMTLPSGLTCLLASGQAFERFIEQAPARPRKDA